MGEVSEAQDDTAQVLEPAVDRFGGPIGGTGVIEERQHIRCSAFQCPAQGPDFLKPFRYAVAELVDQLLHVFLAAGPVLAPVGGDHVQIYASGDLDGHMVLLNERLFESLALFLGEQSCPGVEGPTDPIERIALPAPMASDLLLHPLPAPVQTVSS